METADAHPVVDGRDAAAAAPNVAATRRSVPVNVIAAGIVVAHLCLYGWALSAGYFFSDDYFAIAYAYQHPLDEAFLFHDGSGHMSPASWLIWYLLARGAPYDYTVARLMLLCGQLVVSVGCWLLVREVTRRARWAPLLLAVGLCSPLALPSNLWVANAVTALAMAAAYAYGLWSHLLASRTRKWRWSVVSALCTLGGLLFWEKVAFLPVALFLLSFAEPPAAAVAGRIRRLLRLWPAWAAQVGAVVIYLALRSRHMYSSPPPAAVTAPEVMSYLGRAASLAAVGLLGGPFSWQPGLGSQPFGVAGPSDAVLALGVVALIGLVVWTVSRQRKLLLLWGVLGVHVLLSIGLAGFGRLGVLGDILWRDVRYLSEVPVVALAVVGIVLVSSAPRRVLPLRAIAGLVLAASLWSTVTYVDRWSNAPTREYMTNLLASTPGDGTNLLNTLLPDQFLLRHFAPYDEVGLLIAPLERELVTDSPRPPFHMFSPEGNLVPATLRVVNRIEGQACAPRSVRRAFDPATSMALWIVRVAYTSDADVPATLTVGVFTTPVDLRRGSHELLAYSRNPVPLVSLDATASANLCLDVIEVGVAENVSGRS